MEIEGFISRYVATWNEVDSAIRRERIAELWCKTASLYNRSFDYHGLAGIEQAVTRSYELFVARGYRFRRQGEPASHHGAIRFSWEMITVNGEVDSLGTQFLVLDDHARIRLDYQFIDTPPT